MHRTDRNTRTNKRNKAKKKTKMRNKIKQNGDREMVTGSHQIQRRKMAHIHFSFEVDMALKLTTFNL